MAALAPPSLRTVARSATTAPAKPKRDEGRKPALQTKLKVSGTQDPLEREADRTADRVMRSAVPPSFPMGGKRHEETAQRTTHPTATRIDDRSAKKAAVPSPDRKAEIRRAKKPERDKVQRASKSDSKSEVQKPGTPTAARTSKSSTEKEVHRGAAPTAPSTASSAPPAGFEASLGRVQQGGGQPLAEPTRGFMESGFARSFSDVRVHSDAGAAGLARSIDARAFTLGSDLYFASGEYQPATHDGRRLIAHELTHVVQQTGNVSAQHSVQRASKAKEKSVASTGKKEPVAAEVADATQIVRESDQKMLISFVKDKLPSGTIFVPELHLPKIENDFKGVSDHSVKDIAGVANPERAPLKKSEAFNFVGGTHHGRTLNFMGR